MADAVVVSVLEETKTHYAIHMTNHSDGTGESTVTKVDKSTLLASDDAEPASLDIEQVTWAIQGFSSVNVLWDHTTNDVALLLSGSGFNDFTFRAEELISVSRSNGLTDPRSSGSTGDILVTTLGAAADSTYDITMILRKNPD